MRVAKIKACRQNQPVVFRSGFILKYLGTFHSKNIFLNFNINACYTSVTYSPAGLHAILYQTLIHDVLAKCLNLKMFCGHQDLRKDIIQREVEMLEAVRDFDLEKKNLANFEL